MVYQGRNCQNLPIKLELNMTNNNLSRKLFNEFLSKNPSLVRVDSRNVFDANGTRYAFSINKFSKSVECRQFYEDCDALISLDLSKNVLIEFPRSALTISTRPTRVTANGIKAYDASCSTFTTTISDFVV
jgi:hypothetical protein